METQTLPVSSSLGNQAITSGRYKFPEVKGDISVIIDNKEKVYLEGEVEGKGKVLIKGGRIEISAYSGDVEVTLINCWITSPFVNKASSLLIQDCTFLYTSFPGDLDYPYFIDNQGLKLTLDKNKFTAVGNLATDLVIIKNEGELVNISRTNFYLNFGHLPSEYKLNFIETLRGQVEVKETSLFLTTNFREKPILIRGENSVIKLFRFGLGSEQEFLSTVVEDGQVFFDECFFNGKPIRELMEKQEIVGDYSSHMSGKVYIVYAREIDVDTRKAPVHLQLPLQARHNETILIQKKFSSAFPVKVKVSREKREFILGQGGSKNLSFLLLRYSSKGWVEKARGEEEYKEWRKKQSKSESKSVTKVKSSSKERNKPSRSKDIRAKFNRSRELRKELHKK